MGVTKAQGLFGAARVGTWIGWLRVALMVVGVAIAPRLAGADDIPVVTIDSSGPDRDMPLGKSFYLSGATNDGSERIQPIIVRTSTPSLFGGGGRSCSGVTAALAKFKRKSPDGKLLRASAPDLPDLDPGVYDEARAIFDTGETWSVLVGPAWTRTKTTTADEKFKLLIGGDRFFLTGATYCLLLFRRIRTDTVDSKTLAEALSAYARQMTRCSQSATTPDARRTCKDEADKDFDAAWKEGTKDVPAADATTARTNALALFEPRIRSMNAARTLGRLLDDWTLAKPPRIFAPFDPKAPVSPSDPLGQLLGEMLVAKGELKREDESKPGGYIVVKSNTAVGAFRISDDRTNLLLAPKADVKRFTPLETALSALSIDGTGGLTLRDVIELPAGRVRHGATDFSSVPDLASKLLPIFRKGEDLSEGDAKLALEVQDQLDALSTALAAAVRRYRDAPSAVTPDVLLGKWLATSLLVACSDEAMAAWEAGPPSCEPKDALEKRTSKKGWPGYPETSGGPLGYMAIHLEEGVTGIRAWEASKSKLEVTRQTWSTTRTPPVAVQIGVSQQTWFFSYVTPIVGYAVAVSANDPFPVGYVGVQVHFVPNPVDEPLWTNGARDWARFVAIEAAASLPSKTYGPGNRYRGWEGLPPLLLGLSIHPLPYAGASIGGMLMERRRTPLTGENADAWLGLYVGANVQANIPDLVRGLYKPSSTN